MMSFARLLAAPFRRFARNESGAVTVDWVVITAALCGLIMALFTLLTDSLYENAGIRIATDIAESAER